MKLKMPDEHIPEAVRSRPARGAWVEIRQEGRKTVYHPVAPRKGRVG